MSTPTSPNTEQAVEEPSRSRALPRLRHRRPPLLSPRDWPIFYKVVIFAVALVLLVLTVTTYANTRILQAELQEKTGEEFAVLASSQINNLANLLEQQMTILRTLTLSDPIKYTIEVANLNYSSDAEAVEAQMRAFETEWQAAEDDSPLVQGILSPNTNQVTFQLLDYRESFTEHVQMFVTDAYGGLLAATGREVDYYQADEAWWQAAYNQGQGSVYISQPKYDANIGATFLEMALPIYAGDGERVIGILHSCFSMDSVYEAVGQIRLGATGGASLVDPGGKIIADSRPGRLNQQFPQSWINPEPMNSAGRWHESKGELGVVTSLLGHSSIAAAEFERDDVSTAIQSLGWSLYVHQSLEEAYAPVDRAVANGFLATAIFALIAAGLAYVLARVVVVPITELAEVSRQITAGDWSVRATVRRNDETGKLAIAFNTLTSKVRESIDFLELRVAERSKGLLLAAEIGHTISQLRDLDDLLPEAVELIRTRFDLYYVQIYLADPNEAGLRLQAGTGAIGQELVAQDHRLPFGEGSINGLAASEKRAVIVPDTVSSPLFQPNPALVDTRSEISVPLLAGDRVVGVLDLQSTIPDSLTDDDLPVFEALAGQLAIAIENAALFTERQRAEEELTKFRLGIERSANAVFLTDPDGTIVYVNPAFEGMYGYSKEEALGQTPRILKSGLLTQENYQQFWQTLLAKQVVAGELINKTKDGRLIHVAGSNNPIISDDGEIIGFLSLHSDITERKRAEEELLKFRMGIERSANAVFLTDVDGTIVYVNAAFEEIYGYSREEALGETPRILKSGLLDQEFYEQFWNALLAKEIVFREMVNKTKDGRLVHIDASNNPVVNEDGEVIGFLALHSDITDRKQATEVLAKRAAELEAVAEVSTAVARLSDSERLLQQAADLTKTRFDLYHVHIYLLDKGETELVLTAGAGETGQRMVAEGHRISFGSRQSLVARAGRNRQGVIVNDVQADPGFLPHPLLPETRSEMAVPLIVGKQVLGVLDVQSDEVDHFTSEDVNILTTLAAQVAVALQSARQYEQAQTSLLQLKALQRAITREGWQAFMITQARPFSGYFAGQEGLQPIHRNAAHHPDEEGALPETPRSALAELTSDESAVIMPLSVRGANIGGLGVRGAAAESLSTEKKELLASISREVAEALDKARLSEQTQQQLIDLEAIQQTTSGLTAVLTFEEAVNTLLPQIANAVNADNVALFLKEDDQNVRRVGTFPALEDETITTAGEMSSLSQHPMMRDVVETGEGVILSIDDPRLQAWQHQKFEESGIVANAQIPLMGRGQVFGVLSISLSSPGRTFSDHDIGLLQTLADQAMIAMERVRLLDEMRRKARYEQILRQVTARVSRSTDVDMVMRTAVEELGRALGRRAFVYLGDQKKATIPEPKNGA